MNNHHSNNSRSIATSTARVLNKVNALVRPPESFLKSRPSPKGSAPPAERFQIVHTPDRALVTIPLWEIPRTEADYKAAIKKMKMQGLPRTEGEQRNRQAGEVVVATTATSGMRAAYDQFPPSPRYVVDNSADAWPSPLKMNGRNRNENVSLEKRALADPCTDYGSATPQTAAYQGRVVPISTTRLNSPPGVRSAGLERPRGGLVTSASTPTSARFPPRAMQRRAASAEGLRAPRPLSERPLIYMGPRSGRIEQNSRGIASISSTMTVSPAIAHTKSNNSTVEGAKDGKNKTATDSDTKARRRKTQYKWNIHSRTAGDGERTTNDNEYSRPGVLAAQQPRALQEAEDMRDSETAAAWISKRTQCYICHEPCKAGAGLCSECKSRFQPPLEEVSEDSESEYDLEQEFDRPCPPPKDSPPATPPRSEERRGDSISSHVGTEGTSFGSWSGLSPAQQHLRMQQDLDSRSASVSPTPHLALQLKVFPHQEIRKVSVISPAGNSREDHESALPYIQKDMKLREPMTPGAAAPEENRDGIRVGGVHSGEVRIVDDNNDDGLDEIEGAQHRSRGSYVDWYRYYEEEEEGGGGGYVYDPAELVSPITNCDLFRNHRNRASARSSTYDRIYSIYNAYCDEEDVEDGGMF